jgi:hypothetical protein
MRRLLVWLLLAAFVSIPFPKPVESNFAVAGNGSMSLPRSGPERQGISSADILDFVDTADQQIDTMNSFMFVRHG